MWGWGACGGGELVGVRSVGVGSLGGVGSLLGWGVWMWGACGGGECGGGELGGVGKLWGWGV